MMKTLSAYLRIALSFLLILPASGGTQAKELVKNGGFEQIGNPTFVHGPNGSKMRFGTATPDDWQGGNGGISDLSFIGAPRTADDISKYLAVYGPFPYSSAGGTTPGPSDAGGNFFMQDGDLSFRTPITQMINIPQDGNYTLTCDVAAGQENYFLFTSSTTEWWEITLGNAGMNTTPVYHLSGPPPAPGAPAANVGQWQTVSMTFNNVQKGPTLLSIVARGTPIGQPPISFLDNVSIPGVPEPSSLMLIGIGLMISLAFARNRGKSAPGASGN